MSDKSITIKKDGKYVTLISLKDGWKFSFTPEFKKQLKAWLDSPEENYLNMAFKDWGDKKPSSHDQAKQDGYQPQPISDEIPF